MRKFIHWIIPISAALSGAIAVLLMVGIIGVLVQRGASALNWSFLSSGLQNAGAAGGILYQIVGTLILITTALAVAAPLSLAISLLHSVYLAPESRWKHALRESLLFLNAIPAVLIGILGLLVFVQYFDWGKSWLAGGILLGVMILPTLAVTLIEKITSIPNRYVDAARGLGLRTPQIVSSVILPQSVSALFTGSMLGLARAAGETAPILFAAAVFSGATLPDGIKNNPVLALPYHIFVLAQDTFNPAAQTNLWGSALILLAIVMAFSLAALPLRLRAHEEAHS